MLSSFGLTKFRNDATFSHAQHGPEQIRHAYLPLTHTVRPHGESRKTLSNNTFATPESHRLPWKKFRRTACSPTRLRGVTSRCRRARWLHSLSMPVAFHS